MAIPSDLLKSATLIIQTVQAEKPVETQSRSVTFRLVSSQSDNQTDRQSVTKAARQKRLLGRMSLRQLQPVLFCAALEHEVPDSIILRHITHILSRNNKQEI